MAGWIVAAILTLPVGLRAHGDAQTHGPNPDAGHAGEEGHHDEVTLTPEAIAHYGIKLVTVRKEVLTPSFESPARVTFNLEAVAHVGVLFRGRVVGQPARLGDVVARGDALFTIESPELGEAQNDFLQKHTAVAIATPAVELARSAFERAKSLYQESKGISLTELQKRESEYQMVVGELRSATAALTAAENRLYLMGMDQAAVDHLRATGEIMPRHTVVAPIAGRIVEREITLGELVTPDKDALLVLADTRSLWVVAHVPEARLDQVAVDSRARIKLAVPGMDPIEGRVSLIDTALDANTRTARVRIEVPNERGDLRPGMFAQAEIFAPTPGGNGASVLAIPSDAIQTIEGTTAVFVPVMDEPNTFARRSVTVGKSIGGRSPVLSGLVEGEQIVTTGSFILKADLGKSEAAHEH